LTAANVIAILLAVLLHYSGLQDQQVAAMIQNADQTRAMLPEGPQFDLAAEQLRNPAIVAQFLFLKQKLVLIAIGTVAREKDDFHTSVERALQIDEGEIDASYQLGRIARQQKRYADAIQNFEHVVAHDPAHSLHEIWREVAATYIAAGQFEDARNALEQFLEHRPSDPEGLYLMGRAHAGLGHKREANNLMQACIEAVKTAPAYKYRASKRWLNEAQQFIKGSQ
jgi:predicted Zn-dependent protease